MTVKVINVRNQFKAKIIEIVTGPVVSRLWGRNTLWHGKVSYHHSHHQRVGVDSGSNVVALVKSTEVSIAKL